MEHLIICAPPPQVFGLSAECLPGITCCCGTPINWNKFGWAVFSSLFHRLCANMRKSLWCWLMLVLPYLHLIWPKVKMWTARHHICILTRPNVIWRCSINWKIGGFVMWLYGDRECRLLQIIQMGHLASLQCHNKTHFNTKLKLIQYWDESTRRLPKWDT